MFDKTLKPISIRFELIPSPLPDFLNSSVTASPTEEVNSEPIELTTPPDNSLDSEPNTFNDPNACAKLFAFLSSDSETTSSPLALTAPVPDAPLLLTSF